MEIMVQHKVTWSMWIERGYHNQGYFYFLGIIDIRFMWTEDSLSMYEEMVGTFLKVQSSVWAMDQKSNEVPSHQINI